MTRSPDPTPDQLSLATQAALDDLPPNNVFRTLAHADAAFPSLMTLTASLWNDAVLSQRHRELAILRTARLVDSAYEWMHHIEVARMVGINDDEINAIDVFSVRELVELHLVVGLYATIAGVVADFDVEFDGQSGAFDLDHDDRGPRLGC